MTVASGPLHELSPKRKALFEKLLRERDGSETATTSRGSPDRIEHLPGPGPFPLSFSQERLWFLEQLSQGSAAGLYNVPAAVRLRGAVDVEVLSRTLGTLVTRHEALRTRFTTTLSGPAQTVMPPPADGRLAVSVLDLSGGGRTLAQSEAQAAAAASAEARRPFDLSGQEPLLRASLLRLSADDQILLLTLHHIACDGWSMGVLGRELAVLYEHQRRGQTTGQAVSALGPLPVRYVEFAAWQRGRLAAGSGELGRLVSYWRERLADLAPLSLPTDHPRPAMQSFVGAYEPIHIDPELVRQLDQLGLEHQATLFMVMLAGFAALLSRYSGQEDLAVGSPIANRTRPELEGLVGFFVNTLVLRVDLSGDPSFSELIRRTRECALGAYAHQDLPFERLVEELHPQRDLGRNPLFQVLFQLQASVSRQAQAPGDASSDTINELQTGVAKFDLTFNLWQAASGVAGQAEYSSDLFDRSTISNMVLHYRTLLLAAANHPSAPISSLPMIGPAESARIISELNTSDRRDCPLDATVHGLFEEQAKRTPNATAMEWEGEPDWTYATLDRSADGMAASLRALGVRSGERVAILLPRGGALVSATLGVLKAGGTYLPLDLSCPPARLQFMAKDSGVRAVIVGEDTDIGPFSDLASIAVSREGEVVAMPPPLSAPLPTPPTEAANAEGACYVIYTSGSTGEPKGVVVPHRGVVRLVRNCDYCQLGPADAVAQASNVAFDAATFEIWGALLNGARLVGMSREVTLSPVEFARRLRERNVTTLFVTTALFNVLVREAPPNCFAPLRCLLFGGEAVDARAVRSLLLGEGGRIAPQRLLHVYGPTENTTFSTWHEVARQDVIEGAERRGGAAVPIGRPIANSTACVLDRAMNPVPEGVPGELYVGGDGLALGYLNRPELTERSFVRVGLGPLDSYMYRTGDRVRWRRRRHNGTSSVVLEFQGRLDDQVKVRGFRVEPGEIEAALRGCKGVRDAVVIVQEASGDRRLFAYVVAESEDASLTANGIRQELMSRLPGYMVPAGIMLLAAVPLNANGKVNRAALPEPVYALGEAAVASPLQRTDLEQRIAEQWQQVLGVPSVGLQDNFFDIGGHSLRLVEVHSRLRQALDPALLNRVNLSIVDLFRFPTVSALARHLETAGSAPLQRPTPAPERNAESTATPSERASVPDPVPAGGMASHDPLARQLAERIRRQKEAFARRTRE